VPISLSTLADQVGGCTAALTPLFKRLQAHVLSAERLHGDDTTVPVLAKGKTLTGRIWVYVRDDKPFGGQAPPGAVFYCSRDRAGDHPQAHLVNYSGIFQADAYGGYGKLYEPGRAPGPITEAACWVHARRPFFVMADLAENARRKAQGKKPAVISPMALEAVRQIDKLFEIERSINGQSAEQRMAVRQELSALLVADPEARASRKALARQRGRQGHGLYAQALECVHPLPRRRPDLPVQQRGRTRPARHRLGTQVVAVLRLRSRWRTRRGDVQPDRHGQDERRRSAGLARRCAGAHCRASRTAARRSAAVELAEDKRSQKGRSLTVKGRRVGLSDPEKAVITATCQRFIDEVLKPRFLPTIRPTQFNYPIDILGRWHGNRYRFVQRYRSGQPETLGEEFDAPFTRLDWISRDRFNIQWHRHTGAWFCLHRGLSLVKALKTIETDGLLHPL
jgi:hypothetical protein